MMASFGATSRASGLAAPALAGRGSPLLRHGPRRPPARFYGQIEITKRGCMLQIKHPGQKASAVSACLPHLWLRDNCRCKSCVNPDTEQRSVNTFKIPRGIHAEKVVTRKKSCDIVWSDLHKSTYTWKWLSSVASQGDKYYRFLDERKPSIWNRRIGESLPEVAFEAVITTEDDKGMADLTNKIRVFGFCFVVNTPPTPGATKMLLESIGPIWHTHYGGFYDFIPDLAKGDTAYTNLALAPHTDTTYFTEPAGLQAFHMLSHTPPRKRQSADGDLGGQSILVDGFYAAHRMRLEFRDLFRVLTRVRIPWHASGTKGVAITPVERYPVIEASPDDGGYIHRIRWNNDDRGVVPLEDAEQWYRAAAKWNKLLKKDVNQYRFQLEPGRVLIFDNWRVLHGRTAFEGLRRICGAYISRDDFVSRWKTTNFSRERVLDANLMQKWEGGLVEGQHGTQEFESSLVEEEDAMQKGESSLVEDDDESK